MLDLALWLLNRRAVRPALELSHCDGCRTVRGRASLAECVLSDDTRKTLCLDCLRFELRSHAVQVETYNGLARLERCP